MEALYDRFSRQAFGLAYRILEEAQAAEDVVQDAFLSLWRRAESVDANRGKLVSYLLTLVHRRAIDVIRTRRGLAARTLSDEAFDIVDAAPGVVDQVVTEMDQAAVREALVGLPAEQRQAVDMAYYQGLTHVEIASQLGLPLGTVKSRLRLALTKMREALESQSV